MPSYLLKEREKHRERPFTKGKRKDGIVSAGRVNEIRAFSEKGRNDSAFMILEGKTGSTRSARWHWTGRKCSGEEPNAARISTGLEKDLC